MRNKAKKKKKLNLGGVQQGQLSSSQLMDNQTEQQANSLVNGVGAVNPIVGAFMKVGQGIGSQTMDSNGIYTSKTGQVLDNAINPTTGLTNLKDLSKNFNKDTVASQLSFGLLGESATQQRRKKALERLNYANTGSLISNSQLPTMKQGGKLSNYPKLAVVNGGSLNPISNDAVEVNASNPALTDSVELPNAFVDNNEVIDRKNRVFSDSLTTASGKTIAKEAKKLEKMKSTSPRFSTANKMIESKLDNLFQYQEQMKQDSNNPTNKQLMADKAMNTGNKDNRIFDSDPFINVMESSRKKEELQELFKPKKAVGGTLTDPDPVFKNKAEHDAYYTKQLLSKMQYDNPGLYTKYQESLAANNQADIQTTLMAAGGIPAFKSSSQSIPSNPTNWDKLNYSGNKVEGFRYSKNRPDRDSITNKVSFDKGGNLVRLDGPENEWDPGYYAPEQSTQPNSFNWQQGLNTAATVAPNITNAFLQKRLKGPKAPRLETNLKLQRLSPEAQLADASRQANLANSLITSNTAQGSNLAGSLGSVLSKRLANSNQIYGQVNNANASIQAQEAQLNQGIQARNTERLNGFNQNQVDFNNRKLMMTSENVANLSGKVQANTKERNLADRDKLALEVMKQQYKDSGIYDRNLDALIEDYQKRKSFKMGGKLSKLNRAYKGKSC